MSYSYKEGKDEVHFVTENDLQSYNSPPAQTEVSAEVHEQYPGAVSESGEINWDCPCLGGLGSEGPCVEEFRSAFSCWMFSSEGEQGGEKGDDCVDNFFAMSMCMQQNEAFYDDLNARNKAAAAEALERYEGEEKERLEAAEEIQRALEQQFDEDVTSSDAVVTSPDAVVTSSDAVVTSPPLLEYSMPQSDFSFSNTSVLVAATSEDTEKTETEEPTETEETAGS